MRNITRELSTAQHPPSFFTAPTYLYLLPSKNNKSPQKTKQIGKKCIYFFFLFVVTIFKWVLVVVVVGGSGVAW